MTALLVRRALSTLVLVASVSVVIFALLQAIPGGPLAVYLNNPLVTAEDLNLLRRQLGLDRPLWQQYAYWAIGFVRSNWGFSYSSGERVAKLIGQRLPATLLLMGASFGLASILALVTGVYSAVHRYSSFDYIVTAASFIGISLPTFWFGLILQLVFAVHLGWLPVAGYASTAHSGPLDRIFHLILPMIVLAFFTAGRWSRFTRSGVLEVLSADYIRTARAKGLSERIVIFRHALKNALIPVIAIVALDLAGLFSGAVVTETVFAWPGLGSLMIQSVFNRDYPTLLAILMLSSFAVIGFNFLADVSYLLLDPRVRYV